MHCFQHNYFSTHGITQQIHNGRRWGLECSVSPNYVSISFLFCFTVNKLHGKLSLPLQRIFCAVVNAAGNSVGNSLGKPVGNSVGNCVGNAAGNSVGNPLGNFAQNSAGNPASEMF